VLVCAGLRWSCEKMQMARKTPTPIPSSHHAMGIIACVVTTPRRDRCFSDPVPALRRRVDVTRAVDRRPAARRYRHTVASRVQRVLVSLRGVLPPILVGQLRVGPWRSGVMVVKLSQTRVLSGLCRRGTAPT
jgi:hypothetical protein